MHKETWLSLAACVVLLPLMFVGAHGLTPSAPRVIRPAPHFERARLLAAVEKANYTAAESRQHLQTDCRRFLRELRSAGRLNAFVGELLSLQQKLQLGNDWLSSGNSRARIEGLFAQHVADEQSVSNTLADVARDYQNQLAKEDFTLLTSFGVAPEDAKQAIVELEVAIPAWSGMYDGVLRNSLAEAQKDVARGTFSLAAGNVLGSAVHDGARSYRLNTSKEGSWSDVFVRAAIDLTVSKVLDAALDPTDDIVAELGQQLERAESELLEGPQGLFPLLRRMNEAHEAARQKWLLSKTY